MIAVEVAALERTFRVRKRLIQALAGVSLTVEVGSVHGLLGPNGAGKTTLVKILSTILLPTNGEAYVFGQNVVNSPRQVRQTLGLVLGGDRGLYTRLSAMQNLMYWSALYGVPALEGRRRSRDLLARVGLAHRGNDRVETYSRGMKQRLHLARGLVGDPRLLILDEPTLGLDPTATADFQALVGELRADGMTVLLTTHDLVVAESLCDEVAFIDQGQLLVAGDASRVSSLGATSSCVEVRDPSCEVRTVLDGMDGIVSVESSKSGWLRIELADTAAAAKLIEFMGSAGVVELRTVTPTLADLYKRVIVPRGTSR